MKRACLLAALIVLATWVAACASEPVTFMRIDAKEILSYGVMGLGFLLAAMAWGGLYLKDARLRSLLPLTRPAS